MVRNNSYILSSRRGRAGAGSGRYSQFTEGSRRSRFGSISSVHGGVEEELVRVDILRSPRGRGGADSGLYPQFREGSRRSRFGSISSIHGGVVEEQVRVYSLLDLLDPGLNFLIVQPGQVLGVQRAPGDRGNLLGSGGKMESQMTRATGPFSQHVQQQDDSHNTGSNRATLTARAASQQQGDSHNTGQQQGLLFRHQHLFGGV